MATKSKAKPRTAAKKQASAPAPHGSWSASNLPNPGEIRYTADMKQRLMDEVKEADKAGIPRSHVFKALAKEWSKGKRGPHRFTEHQVSSQFHVLKTRFGYDVRRAPGVSQRRITKPRTLAPSMTELMSQLEDQFLAKQQELQSELLSERRARKAAEKKLAKQQAKLAEARAAQRKLRKLEAALS